MTRLTAKELIKTTLAIIEYFLLVVAIALLTFSGGFWIVILMLNK